MKGTRGKLRKRVALPLLLLAACAAAGVLVGRYVGGPEKAPTDSAYHVVETTAPQEIGTVTIYTMSTCTASQDAKLWLAREGFAYTEKVVDQSEQALSEVKRLGAQRTPLLVIGRYQMEGFDPGTAKRLITDKHVPASNEG